jgi:oxalate decarboxylase
LLVFDDGSFSEFDTFTITDWFAHTPKDVLAANFGVPESAFANIPTKQRYIFQTKTPGSLESDEVSDPYGTVPKSFTHRLLAQDPIVTPGGERYV